MQVNTTTVAVVTGAASGIGEALARALDERGARVALCDIDLANLERVASSLRSPPLIAQVDVSSEAEVQAFAQRVLDTLGPPTLVIANAGVAFSGNVADSPTEDIERVLAIDLFGVMFTVRSFLKPMLTERTGTIVTISSLFGLIGVPNQSAYCAAKAGVKGFTESLDIEVRPQGLQVMCVHPGAIATNIVVRQRSAEQTQGVAQSTAEKLIARGLKPEVAATQILVAVERGKRRLVLGRDARLVSWLQRIFPVRYRDLVGRWNRSLSR